jgi:hypothetical protein
MASAAKAADERNMEAINTPRKRFISNPPCGLLLVLLKRKTMLPPSLDKTPVFRSATWTRNVEFSFTLALGYIQTTGLRKRYYYRMPW